MYLEIGNKLKLSDGFIKQNTYIHKISEAWLSSLFLFVWELIRALWAFYCVIPCPQTELIYSISQTDVSVTVGHDLLIT